MHCIGLRLGFPRDSRLIFHSGSVGTSLAENMSLFGSFAVSRPSLAKSLGPRDGGGGEDALGDRFPGGRAIGLMTLLAYRRLDSSSVVEHICHGDVSCLCVWRHVRLVSLAARPFVTSELMNSA